MPTINTAKSLYRLFFALISDSSSRASLLLAKFAPYNKSLDQSPWNLSGQTQLGPTRRVVLVDAAALVNSMLSPPKRRDLSAFKSMPAPC